MSSRLVPCSACSRHIRLDADDCPFCGVLQAERAQPTLPQPTTRLGSLALMTFRAATLGVAITACGGQSNEPSGQGGSAGEAGTAGTAGTSTSGGTNNDTGSGGASGGNASAGGSINVNTGGAMDPNIGGQVSIYRATPRG